MPAIARLAAAFGAASLSVASPSSAQPAPAPAPVMCLPAGGSPAPCGAVRAGQTVRLQLATTSLPTGSIHLRFVESGPGARSARVTLPPDRSRDGGYDVPVPTALCPTGVGSGNFTVERLRGSGDDAAVDATLGVLAIAC